jgi:hypothetical protein
MVRIEPGHGGDPLPPSVASLEGDSHRGSPFSFAASIAPEKMPPQSLAPRAHASQSQTESENVPLWRVHLQLAAHEFINL